VVFQKLFGMRKYKSLLVSFLNSILNLTRKTAIKSINQYNTIKRIIFYMSKIFLGKLKKGADYSLDHINRKNKMKLLEAWNKISVMAESLYEFQEKIK